MPSITPLGLARQTTLSAKLCEIELENAMILLEPDASECLEKARIYHRQIVAWREFAKMRSWKIAERHASTMECMTEQWMLACQA